MKRSIIVALVQLKQEFQFWQNRMFAEVTRNPAQCDKHDVGEPGEEAGPLNDFLLHPRLWTSVHTGLYFHDF